MTMYLVSKPWGVEYRILINSELALTFLNINPGAETSMHCHPIKTTSMLCISGKGAINFFNSQFTLSSGKKFTIRNGLFHQIQNISETKQLLLLEFENPADENDLIRFSDNYGRTALPYEDALYDINSSGIPAKLLNLVQSRMPIQIEKMFAEVLTSTDLFKITESEFDTYVVLEGCVRDELTGKKVLRIGDCVGYKTLIKLLNRFENVEELLLLHLKFARAELNG